MRYYRACRQLLLIWAIEGAKPNLQYDLRRGHQNAVGMPLPGA